MTNHIFIFGLRFLFFYLQLSDDLGYVLYSALGSFYIPSCIMVFVYIRIYFAAKARARRGIKKKPLKSTQEQVILITCIFVPYRVHVYVYFDHFSYYLSSKWNRIKWDRSEWNEMKRDGTKRKKNDKENASERGRGRRERKFSTKKGKFDVNTRWTKLNTNEFVEGI